MTGTFDAIVVGGGVVGLTAALAMSQRGFSIALLDDGPLDCLDNGRVYAINDASKNLFKQLGVWEMLDKTSLSPYSHMEVWDAKSGASIHFDSRLKALPQLGFILEEIHIKQALLQKIAMMPSITVFSNCHVDHVASNDDNISISSADAHWTGKLLMVADGAHSPTRQRLQVPLTTWSYHQHALVGAVHTEKPHQKTAYQVFHPEGPLAFLPLTDPHHCSIVWTTTPVKAQQLMALSEGDFNTALTEAFAARLGQVTLSTKRHQFPLMMRHAKQYTGKNWLLLGDAAHTIHPLAGLGLNLGLADVATWISCLDLQNKRLIAASALGKYQRQRKHATWQVIVLMEALKTIFGSTFSPFVVLRSLGLRACDSLTPLKRMIIAEAMGS